MNIRFRPAAVAGAFYPASPERLGCDIAAMLAGATYLPENHPKAIIVPHAGYVYSGAIAASAFAMLASGRRTIRRVLLLGPTHRVAVRGLALPNCGAFVTPLGTVPIDRPAAETVRNLPQVVFSDLTHRQEHSLEVELPFLQVALEGFSLLPMAVGEASPEAVADVLERLWGGPETLIVVSSDLSHYLPYDDACTIDAETARRIGNLDPTITPQQACGAAPVNGLLLAARKRGLRVRQLDLRNSGDTAGDRRRVVGYGAFAFFETSQNEHRENSAMSTDPLGQSLLTIARNAIGEKFGLEARAVAPHPDLEKQAATFVTLTQKEQLRGCIGSLVAHRPLAEDVAANALAAAFRDSRFPPLRQTELEMTRVEVSLLDTPTPLRFANETEALSQLRPGIDGLILDCENHRATFLPQVWESLPTPQLFLQNLKLKAGLPANFWSPRLTLARYGVQKWKEK
ncbi:MAG: AmmeMemoRadiSam system protein B [Candidatus Accumulibacter sp.]|jgi:AmmeMemoRadiSam system protein B/AmmeMemoRadiSam system protein A|nr:AmmeMemoRadiSam system protein B [Accumulibacter sp.]